MTGLSRLTDFLTFLRKRKIEFYLDHQQDDAIMVLFALVGARVEVEFFEDYIEFSQFRGSEGVDCDEAELRALIAELWDSE
jgi:hypothetical protein